MTRFACTALAATLMLATGAAGAQSYRGAAPVSGAQYDYARVVRVDPVFDRYATAGSAPQQRCYDQRHAVGGGTYEERRVYGGDGYYGGYGDGYGQPRAGSEVGRTTATIIGGVLGAVVGSKVGGGSARYATSALGSLAGSAAGRAVYEQTVRNRTPDRTATITVCDPVPDDGRSYNGYPASSYGNVREYDVTYEYAGRQYVARTDHHPGDRIRVRVDVRPE